MLAIAQGQPTEIEWRPEPIEFTAAGEVHTGARVS
jgi:hypothetical protein